MSTDTTIAAGISYLRRADKNLKPWIAEHGKPNLTRTRDSFRDLSRAIVGQQLHGKAAASIYMRFAALCESGRPTPQRVCSLSMKKLRTAGLSASKAGSIQGLAAAYSDGLLSARVFRRCDDDEIRRRLTSIKGIGDWTVDMFMMFGLYRLDILPVGDYGVRKGMQRYFQLAEMPKPKELPALAQAWRPYRSIASWYMWRVAESD